MKKSALFILTIISFSFFQCQQDNDTITDCSIVTGKYGIVNSYEVEYIYNEDFSRVEKAIYYNDPERFTDYVYDETGKLIQLNSFSSPNISLRCDYVYNDNHQLIAGKKYLSDQGGPYEIELESTYHYNSNDQLDSVTYFRKGHLEHGVKLYYNVDNPGLIDQTTKTYYDTTTNVEKWIYKYHYSDVKNPNMPDIEIFRPELFPELHHTEYAREITESIYVARSGNILTNTYHYTHEVENGCLRSISRTLNGDSWVINRFFYQ